MVQGIIAGGEIAMFRSQEGAEDRAADGAAAIDTREIGPLDVVCGIAAGGTTPFVHGALKRARERQGTTIFLTCVEPIPAEPEVDCVIRPITGPEVLTGSTRLKAGTATKLILNQITTISMVQLGKVYQNLMVDMRASNDKLWERGARTVGMLTGLSKPEALELLKRAEGHVKLAVVMHERQVSIEAARELLEKAGGRLHDVLDR